MDIFYVQQAREHRFRLSALEHYLDTDVFRNLGTHQLAQCTFISINIDETFVHTHLPAIPGRRAFPVRTFPDGNNKLAGGERDGTGEVDACTFSNLSDLVTDLFNFLVIGTGEPDTCLLHNITPKNEGYRNCFLTTAAMV